MPEILKRWGLRIGLARAAALIVLILLLWVRYEDPVLVEAIRLRSFDLMQRIDPRPLPAPMEATGVPSVLIVDIDEASIDAIGQWPWPRTTMARLVDRLMASGAVAVGFDIVFSEPDRTSPAAIARQTEGIDDATRAMLTALPDHDAVFAGALARCRCVLGYSVLSAAELGPTANTAPEPPASIAEIGGDPRGYLRHLPAVLSPLPMLQAATQGRGIFTMDPDQDGLVRRVPLMLQVGSAGPGTQATGTPPATAPLPALSVEMLRVAMGAKTYAIKMNQSGIFSLVVGQWEIPVDESGQIWIRFGNHADERFVSAEAVLNGEVGAERIANRFVLIGTSAVGLRDQRATPVDLLMAGVEIHAQILENVLNNEFLLRPNYMLSAELVATLAFALLLIAVVPAIRASWSFGVLVLAVAGAALVSWYFFDRERLLVDPSFPIATAGVLYAVLVYLSHYRTEMQRQRTAEAFGRYLSPKMAERVSRDRNALKLGGDERILTVMFADARGFTALSERYAGDPQTLTGIVNRFLSAMSEEIQKLDGTVDKYMGDAVMAFWNAPEDQPAHAATACRAALAMQVAIAELNEAWANDPAFAAPETPPRIGVGVGINTGRCVVGNMGSESRLEYSVIGDPVNLASRIESQTKSYRVPIMITEATQREAPQFAALEIDRIAVKGKAEAVTVYALLGDETMAASDAYSRLASAQADFLADYRAQRWDEARAKAAALAADRPALAGLYALFETRIAALEAEPPGADWDGVYVAVEK